jgi:sulfoxide reductase heme-binding subunit YedZ
MILPALRLAWQFHNGEFGILPIAWGGLTFWSGVWATAILLLSLTVTPAIVVSRWHILIDVRRMIGVAALVYTIVHMVIYFGLRSWNAGLIGIEMVTRPTLIAALVSTIGLIALGATSFDAAVRTLGAKGWQRLHNLNYPITALAILHIFLARGTYPEQYLLTGIFFWVMVWRLFERARLGRNASALLLLALVAALFTALLEAGTMWAVRGYELSWTLGNNFNLAYLDVGVPPAWQVLAFGLLFAITAPLRRGVVAVAFRPAQDSPAG